MRTLVALSTLAVSLLLTSCRDQDPLSPDVAVPDFAIMDAAHGGGNPDFFFLPPMVPDPVGHLEFEEGEFNSDVKPEVFICELEVTDGDGDPVATTVCDPDAGALKIEFTMNTGPGSETVRLNEVDEHYIANWHTDEFGLDPDRFYRIHVRVGATPLGFADLNPLSNGRELRNVNTNEVIGLVDGRTLPIKFRIESGALCDPPGSKTCTSGTVDLEQGGSVVLDETGDRIDIPAQDEAALPRIDGEPVTDVTITLELCGEGEDINVDLPTFGNCLRITTDPELTELNTDLEDAAGGNWDGFSPRALVSICSAATSGDFGLGEQHHLLTVHRERDDGFVQALPHADDNCAGEAETTAWADGLRGLAQRSLHALGRGISRLGSPAPLHARARLVRLDEGLGGESRFSSKFQLALPAMMEIVEATNNQTALEGGEIPEPLQVFVTDRDGHPVEGATVHFEVTEGGGSLGGPTSVESDEFGIAQSPIWTLGSESGVNQVEASGFGIAGEGQEPFMPVNRDPVTDEPIPSDQQEIVDLETGAVLFTAAGCTTECAVETIDLTVGGGVVLPEEGDRLDIPEQGEDALPRIGGELVTEVTIILELCDEDIDVDLPTYGNCLRITTDPQLTELNTALEDGDGEAWGGFSPRAVVSMCSAAEAEGFGLGDQHHLLTVHRENDEGAVQALPHAEDNCFPIIGSRPSEDRGTFVQRSLDALRRGVARLAGPEPLHAHVRGRLVRLDEGLGGESRFSSKFQLALPAMMEIVEATNNQTAAAGSNVDNPPAVRVMDRDGNPVVGATVHFQVTEGDGSVTPLSVTSVLSGGEFPVAIAAAGGWELGAAAGTNQVRAFGKGIAGPPDGPFMPDLDSPTDQQEIVDLETGEVFFTALGLGLVSHWTGDGTFEDAVGDHDLQTVGGIGFAAGIVGDAFQFSRGPSTTETGGWAYAHPTEDIDTMERFTIATWVYLDPAGPGDTTQRFVSLNGEKAVIRHESGRVLNVYAGTEAQGLWDVDFLQSVVLETGCWQHVAATFDGVLLRAYLNGEEVGAGEIPAGAQIGDGNGVFLSNSDNGAGWPPLTGPNAEAEKLEGALDEVQIYNRALTVEEIQDRFGSAGSEGLCDTPEMILTFTQQPTNTLTGNTISPSVVVQATTTGEEPIPGATITLDNSLDTPADCGVNGLPAQAITDATGNVTFSGLTVTGSCTATLLATGAQIGFAETSVGSEAYDIAALAASGAASIDGVIDEGEWDGAACVEFDANLPDGGTTPATLCVMNDHVNFYASFVFDRAIDPQSLAAVEFDMKGDGVLGIAPGNDLILVQQPPQGGFFRDEHIFEGGTCPESSICTTSDDNADGAVDGEGAFLNDSGRSVYELSHPLSSGDAFDISVGVGDVVQIQGVLSIRDELEGTAAVTRQPTGQTGVRMLILQSLGF